MGVFRIHPIKQTDIRPKRCFRGQRHPDPLPDHDPNPARVFCRRNRSGFSRMSETDMTRQSASRDAIPSCCPTPTGLQVAHWPRRPAGGAFSFHVYLAQSPAPDASCVRPGATRSQELCSELPQRSPADAAASGEAGRALPPRTDHVKPPRHRGFGTHAGQEALQGRTMPRMPPSPIVSRCNGACVTEATSSWRCDKAK